MSSHIKVDYCDLPRVKRSKRGTIWVCDCGKAYLAAPRKYYTDTGEGIRYIWVRIEPPKQMLELSPVAGSN
jgi:ribosomal protein L37AE/L43A